MTQRLSLTRTRKDRVSIYVQGSPLGHLSLLGLLYADNLVGIEQAQRVECLLELYNGLAFMSTQGINDHQSIPFSWHPQSSHQAHVGGNLS